MIDFARVSANKIRSELRLVFGICHARLFARFDTLKKPSHILCQHTYGLQAFLVFFYFFGGIAVDLIPILRGHDGHIVHHKIFIDNLKRSRCAAASAGNDSRCGLALHLAACREEKSVEEGCDLSRNARVIDGRADDDAVDLVEIIDDVVYLIVKGAEPRFAAKSADDTARDGLFAEINDLCFDAVLFKDLLCFCECGIGTAEFVRAAVDQ
jgi:hypothetical protein